MREERIKWEGDVIFELEVQLEITTSDAQGLLMAHTKELNECWASGISAKGTAEVIDKASLASVWGKQ